MTSIQKIGLIVCSTRQPRACPQITQFILDTINYHPTTTSTKPTIKTIDLLDWNLPLYNESGIPSQITSSTDYDHAHTRAWSAEIAAHDAFIFVVPQYNWGYPAAVKNAIDYLYHEWKGKPALVVSYGGHGGGKCNRQLREVLAGVRMRVNERNVELTFPDKEVLMRAAKGEDVGLDGRGDGQGIWSEQREGFIDAFEELLR